MTSAAGIIYSAGGKILLLKRNENSVHGGTWGLPAGGIEVGETAKQAALREFGEETGSPCSAALTFVNETGGFSLYRCEGDPFNPVLNEEHTDFIWAGPESLPTPLHPGLADQIACVNQSEAMDWGDSARQRDVNGYITIKRNAITRSGVFKYSGKSLPGGDPNQMYDVLRPIEELASPEAIESFKLLPIIDEHVMLGDGYSTPAEAKGVHGSTGEDIVVEGRDVLAPLRIFSSTLKRLIDAGKKGLSLGYRCRFEKSSGVFEGMPYDYIQRDIRGNHLALVREGRVGTEVLDHHWAFDHFDLALDDKGEETMADETTEKKTDAKDEGAEPAAEGKKEMTLTEVSEAIAAFMPIMAKMQEFMAASAPTATAEVLDADEEEKKDDEKKEEKKEDAMDSAEITALKARIANLESRGSKAVSELVREVTPVVGTFDHSEMSVEDVAKYAVSKLGIQGVPAGHERTAVAAYMAAHKARPAATFAMDSKAPKAGGLFAKRINGAA